MKGGGVIARVLRGVWGLMQRAVGSEAEWRGLAPGDAGRDEVVPEVRPGRCPKVVFLFAGVGTDARRALEMFPGEVRAWRAMAEMEAARARVWSGEGRLWDAGMCAGRAQAYQAAASQVEEVLIESLGLWEQFERRVGDE